MTFHSILFEKIEDNPGNETHMAPPCFVDLNLDQVVDAITKDSPEYDLKPFFYSPLSNGDTTQYRHEIMQDLENAMLLQHIKSFAQKMSKMRQYLALMDKLTFHYHKEGWLLETVDAYCDAVISLAHGFTYLDIKSRSFLAFREYLTNYVNSDGFISLVAETKKQKANLLNIKYCVIIK